MVSPNGQLQNKQCGLRQSGYSARGVTTPGSPQVTTDPPARICSKCRRNCFNKPVSPCHLHDKTIPKRLLPLPLPLWKNWHVVSLLNSLVDSRSRNFKVGDLRVAVVEIIYFGGLQNRKLLTAATWQNCTDSKHLETFVKKEFFQLVLSQTWPIWSPVIAVCWKALAGVAEMHWLDMEWARSWWFIIMFPLKIAYKMGISAYHDIPFCAALGWNIPQPSRALHQEIALVARGSINDEVELLPVPPQPKAIMCFSGVVLTQTTNLMMVVIIVIDTGVSKIGDDPKWESNYIISGALKEIQMSSQSPDDRIDVAGMVLHLSDTGRLPHPAASSNCDLLLNYHRFHDHHHQQQQHQHEHKNTRRQENKNMIIRT